ncbi:hypothetical protein R1flu_012636 [Riccia fluitans]|uniref:non-specific serine/threonine protein kinase n=1 Tax=Riccia fluitans TaxID=41844 RepID=A0ABD1ZDN3_9MARC
MAADFPGPIITELDDRITRLQGYLLEVKELKINSKKLVEEIRTFAGSLEVNLQFLKTNLPPTVSTKALGTLANDVEEANTFMAEALQRGKFKSLWTDRETRSKLESWRQKLVSAFQLAFIITSLDVTFDGYKRLNNFQERMQELYSVHTSDAAGARTQIQDLLQRLVSRINGQDERLQSLVDYVESGLSRSNAAESTDVQKFFADVLAAVDKLQNDYQLEELMYDPVYTDDLMWDPVKASDGFTYDRWTIVENDDHPYHRSLPNGRSPFTREPLSVLCDDVTVRQRLYNMEKFRNENLEKKCKEMREKYRITTLELVMEGHDGEALERLEHLLTWAPEDAVCRKHRDTISDRLGKLKAAEENLWTTVEVLRPQSKLGDAEAKMSAMEQELQRLKKEREVQANSMEEELKKLEEKDGIEIQRLVKENSSLQACLFAVKEEAESKMSSMEEELETLKKEYVAQVNFVEEELKKLEAKDGIEIQRLGMENSNLEACLSVVKKEAEAKISSMEKELKSLSVAKEEAEAKISSMDEELEKLKREKEVQVKLREKELNNTDEEYRIEIQRLGKENSNLQACLSAVKEEAEVTISSMEEELRRLMEKKEFQKEEAEAKISSLMEELKSLKKEKEAQLNFREEEMRRRKNEAEDKVDSTFMEGTMGFQRAKKKGMKSTVNSSLRGMMPSGQRELKEIQEALAREDVKPRFFDSNDLKTATSGFSEYTKLGQGGSGDVYKAMLSDGSVVAVKILRPTDQYITNFLNEMVLLTGIKHKHLIQLKGCCIRDRKRLLVYEYAENGNLANALWGPGRTCELDWDQRFKICVGIAKGLCYLHEELQPRIIHRDIEPYNILLDKNFEAKIADFGLALPLNEWSASGSTQVATQIAGTVGYFSPEYATSGIVTEKLDVFSYGILLLEIVAGQGSIDQSFTDAPHRIYLRNWAFFRQYWEGKVFDNVAKLVLATGSTEQILRVSSKNKSVCTSVSLILSGSVTGSSIDTIWGRALRIELSTDDVAVDITGQLEEQERMYQCQFDPQWIRNWQFD